MKTELRRATDPEEMEFGQYGCGVCLVPFQVDAVQMLVETPEAPLAATPICPTCIEYLGRRNPARFLTIEEYDELKQRYPEPIFDHVTEEGIWQRVYGFDALIDRGTLAHQPITGGVSS